MHVPDRPRACTDVDATARWRTDTDYRPRSEHLAERLARLAEGHPSAWPDRSNLNPDEPNTEDTDRDDGDAAGDGAPDDGPRDEGTPADADPGNADLADLPAEDLENPEVGAGRGADNGPRAQRSAGSATWESLVGDDHRPYRPWFSADGGSDPWFAEPTDGASR